ncbi:bifunctional riboflavin kinase/FAD synthetase [Wenyingzhuangia aestuarii]|uniref:bifunctional riboflavin kinase/FAD synthetase n=1 Tax=Wenyingzhuangia aestuarii TaxID=1647582 RepID=UPI0014399BDD|nr:bifunctional riboflavin kinase/FAD synthetase [Wenyingzhuangia aestuarii]NJB81566.1 riboflavin kinase/FMN adenylyltransferase [Wenyingzhuangia aestuarii]
MEVIHNYHNFPENIATVVTIGTFDGVHVGHRKILDQLFKEAKAKGLKSVLLTFFPHPRMVVQSDNSIKLINTIDERIDILSKTDLDYLVIQPFDRDFSNLSAFDFVRDVLVTRLNVKELVVGYDHRFGKNREGDFEQLKEYSHTFDFKIKEIKAQDINNTAVSSTKVRNALNTGEIEIANQYLTTPFFINGIVVKGQQLGATIGYPTANIEISEVYKLTPKNGVYVILATHKEQNYYGMLNIGNRPTVNGKDKTIEAHIFDFDFNIYGEDIKIEFLYYLREEEKFYSIEALKEQLAVDKKNSLNYIQNLTQNKAS